MIKKSIIIGLTCSLAPVLVAFAIFFLRTATYIGMNIMFTWSYPSVMIYGFDTTAIVHGFGASPPTIGGWLFASIFWFALGFTASYLALKKLNSPNKAGSSNSLQPPASTLG